MCEWLNTWMNLQPYEKGSGVTSTLYPEAETETSTKISLTPEHLTTVFKWPLGSIKIIMALEKDLKFQDTLNVKTFFKSNFSINLDRIRMAVIFLLPGDRSMVPLSLRLISHFWVLIGETGDCPGNCFWALLPKVLWALTHPRRENHRLFVQIISFQEQKSLWGFINSPTSPGAHVLSCCLVLGLCSRAVFQLQERHSGPCCPNIL